mmetsp:Transcript_9001/g.23484  ORF Transcript_9001/g.23484 Transcript_9001/m.23484 type:complete len:200 (-) Transcript_9001:218-817(-)
MQTNPGSEQASLSSHGEAIFGQCALGPLHCKVHVAISCALPHDKFVTLMPLVLVLARCSHDALDERRVVGRAQGGPDDVIEMLLVGLGAGSNHLLEPLDSPFSVTSSGVAVQDNGVGIPGRQEAELAHPTMHVRSFVWPLGERCENAFECHQADLASHRLKLVDQFCGAGHAILPTRPKLLHKYFRHSVRGTKTHPARG